MSETAKLHWQCRRGMLELDLLLSDYLQNRYPYADNYEKSRFVELLSLEDDDLLAVMQTQWSFQHVHG